MDSLHCKFMEMMSGKSGKVLDAGAGTGEISKALSDMGFGVTSCDIAPRYFKYRKCAKVDLNSPMPFRSSFFDHVVCAEVIEHLENPHNLLREFNRVIKNGGTLVISTPNIANVFSRVKFLITGKFFCFSDKERILGHLNPVAWWEMEDAFQMHGFRLDRRASSADLKISGCSGGMASAKRTLARLFLLMLPFIKPKDSVLLKADSIIFAVTKVRNV